MAIQISPNLPANVVEIGNEITQAKINEINSGTLALQTWVSASYLTTSSASSTYQTISGMSSYLTTSSASSTYAPKASPTFTGTVTIPAGASITGYLTTSSASSTYQTISGMTSYLTTSAASSTYQTIAGMSSYLTDAPSNGSEYVRKNGAWSVATGGGGGVAWGAITGTVTDQTDLTTYIGGLGYQTASDVSTYVTSLGYQTATDVSTYVTSLGYLTSVPTKSITTYTSSPATFSTGDANNIVYLASGGMGFSPTVPDDSSVAFANGTEITIVVDNTTYGYGIQGGMGVAINNSSSVSVTNYVSKLVKISTNTWFYS